MNRKLLEIISLKASMAEQTDMALAVRMPGLLDAGQDIVQTAT